MTELVKFGSFFFFFIFDIIKELLTDFIFKSIECLCQILDNWGRYIYLNKATKERFGQILDIIKT